MKIALVGIGGVGGYFVEWGRCKVFNFRNRIMRYSGASNASNLKT